MEEIAVVILRFLHIFLGMIWIGFGILAAFVLNPAANRLGENGAIMLRTFYGYTRFGTIIAISSVGTTVAGLILWPLRTQNGMDFLAFSNTGDIVMSIGAVFGLLAFGHGAFATGRATDAFAKAVKAYDSDPSEANQSTLQAAKKKLFTHGNISAGISLVAVICMSGARYLV